MGILTGHRVLITGVARTDSIALAVADHVQREGGEVALAVFPRDVEEATIAAKVLARPPVCVVPADITSEEDLRVLERTLAEDFGPVDAALHAVAFAPAVALEGVLGVPSAAVELALRTSAHSYASLAGVLSRLAPPTGASLVGLDFENGQAWQVYNWMGPVKAALRSLNQYLARDLGHLGIRTNLIAAGPLATRAASGIPDFEHLLRVWHDRAPLAWDPRDARPVADAACFLFSDLARAITGEVLHVDGGVHAIAAGRDATASVGA